jgi:hypothetical protein
MRLGVEPYSVRGVIEVGTGPDGKIELGALWIRTQNSKGGIRRSDCPR